MTVIVDRESLLMRGTLDMCVLTLLSRHPLHAYGVVQHLQEHGFTQTSYGTVYPLVSRLRRQGLLAQDLQPGGSGPARNVLSLTDEGRLTLREWTKQWREVNERISQLIEERR
ncbi:MAG: PadR family transcriptional regulator [Nocardioides sp.]|uniref:PadR family transcriptional regulator n=1 Tax=Nocardioides sp. TaxID=35761 RepID=UPI0032646FC1